jgi:hypothetical protein
VNPRHQADTLGVPKGHDTKFIPQHTGVKRQEYFWVLPIGEYGFYQWVIELCWINAWVINPTGEPSLVTLAHKLY